MWGCRNLKHGVCWIISEVGSPLLVCRLPSSRKRGGREVESLRAVYESGRRPVRFGLHGLSVAWEAGHFRPTALHSERLLKNEVRLVRISTSSQRSSSTQPFSRALSLWAGEDRGIRADGTRFPVKDCPLAGRFTTTDLCLGCRALYRRLTELGEALSADGGVDPASVLRRFASESADPSSSMLAKASSVG